MPKPLAPAAVERALAELPGWALQGGKLHREFVFRDFVEAFGWMTQVALAAESMDHHPEWRNVYSRVEVDLTSHDAGGITERDLALARRMEALARSAAAAESGRRPAARDGACPPSRA